MTSGTFTMYTTPWCGYCHRLKSQLDREGISYDIVDIELRAVAQGYGPILNQALGLPNKRPNNLLGDGVDANEKPFSTSFPYAATPHQGYETP